MGQLDEAISAAKQDLSFEKAHAMQVSVQASLGQMNQYGDTIARRYGTDSAEYAQFVQQKQATLATTQSSIHQMYGTLTSQINQAAISATAATASNMAMYQNYNEQKALDVYQAAAATDQQYKLDATNQLLALEQLKMSNNQSLVKWVADTPVFSVSLSSLFSLLA